jgi:hypothetical protein
MSEPVLLEEPIPPAPKRRRRWLGCGLVILFVLTACSGFYGYLLYTGDRDLREAEAEADRSDPQGWRLDEIDNNRKVLATEENAAEVVMAIKSSLPAPWPPPRPLPGDEAAAAAAGVDPVYIENDLAELPPDVQLDEALLRDLTNALKKAEPAMPLVRKLPTLRDGRYPLTWSKDIVSTLINSQDARTAANLMRYRAVLLAQQNKPDEALEATRGILVAARSVGDEPLLISQLIRIACTAIATQTLERVLAQGEPSSEALKQMQELLELEEAEPLLLYAVRGERAGLHQMMTQMKSGNVKASVITGNMGGGGGQLFDAVGPFLARGSHGRMLRLLTEEVEIAKLPPEQQPERQQAVERKIKEAKVHYDVLIAMLMPAYVKVGEAWRRDQAYLRCAIVAVAAERYRSDHNAWPKTLAALVPDYLKAVPLDPYDGQPLRYKVLPDGAIVYSVGPDKEDNDGARNRHNPLSKGTDFPFRLWNVDRRRQPPAELLTEPNEILVP